MKIRILISAILISLLLTGLSTAVSAQTRRRVPATTARVPATTAQSLLARLPTSDAVAQVNVKRVLTEAMPKLLAGNSAKLAEVDSHIEQFKTRTSLDLRSFDEIALGMLYSYPSAGITKIDTVAVARGAFSTSAIIAAGRLAAEGKYREEKYLGKTIYIFTLDQQVKLLGLLDLKIRELAVTPMDANTLPGRCGRIRDTVAASRERSAERRVDRAGYAGSKRYRRLRRDVPRSCSESRIGNEAIAKDGPPFDRLTDLSL